MIVKENLPPVERIENRILIIRGQKVMIDADLAELYGVPTKALNQAVKRNSERFPADFMYQLSAEEKAEVVTNCDHLARLKFSRSLPFAFTEHGAIQAANVLGSPRKIMGSVPFFIPFFYPPRRPIGFVTPNERKKSKGPADISDC